LNLSAVIAAVSQDKNLDRSVIIDALEQAILHAAQKDFGPESELEVAYNESTEEIDLFQFRTVVEEVEDKDLHLTLEEAQKLDPGSEMGDSIGVRLDTSRFGRIAAQAAKQIIMQKVNQAERHKIYERFKDRKGEILSGYVRRIERRNIIVDLGQVEAVIPAREQLFGERFRVKDRIQAYVIDVSSSLKGPQIILSRAVNEFLEKLFEQNVTEIYDQIVEIISVARDPGHRAKVAVYSRDSSVDPVGACVGMKGARIQIIVNELGGEKIDVVPWDNDPAVFVCDALSPAVVSKVIVDEDNHSMEIIVAEDQLSLAIGRRGQNVRLAAQLTGWKLDIKSEVSLEKQMESFKAILSSIEGLGEMHAGILINEDIKTPQELSQISTRALIRLLNLDEEVAEAIIEAAKTKAHELSQTTTTETQEFSVQDTSASPDMVVDNEKELQAKRKKERMELFLKLKGVGEATADALANAGYATIGDLIADSNDEIVMKTELPIAVVKTVIIAADKYMLEHALSLNKDSENDDHEDGQEDGDNVHD